MHVKLNTLSVELNPAMEQARMARGETEARDSQVWLGEGLILCCTHVFGCVGRSCRPYDYFQTLKDKIKSLKVVEERPSENNNKYAENTSKVRVRLIVFPSSQSTHDSRVSHVQAYIPFNFLLPAILHSGYELKQVRSLPTHAQNGPSTYCSTQENFFRNLISSSNLCFWVQRYFGFPRVFHVLLVQCIRD
jgi:hypothetical protein